MARSRKKSAKLGTHEKKISGNRKKTGDNIRKAKNRPVNLESIAKLVADGNENVSLPALRRSMRRVMHAPAPRYFVEPEYGDHSAVTGATWMEATIGPAQGGRGMYGSTPAPNTPTIMRRLLDNHPGFGWVAGHLLNDNLGGPGLAHNLTPLTTAGNKNHLIACEKDIKNYITKAYSRTLYNQKDKFFYGMYYRVVVSAEKWDGDNDISKVATHLIVSAHPVTMDKVSGEISDVGIILPGGMSFAPIADLAVENTGNEGVGVGDP